ncbi:MAG: hypothetical protein HY266_04220 [Deltaproteobacteria bacterium]|nr:hypothetical protein [Deltaproteobacteria bacterium]
MKKHIFTVLLAFVFGIGITLIASTESMAVHKNYDGKLTCGNCHTMHNSQGGASLGGNAGGSLVLLRGAVTDRSQIHNICLQCHGSNGAQATATFGTDAHPAPKVYIDGAAGYGNDTADADGLRLTNGFSRIGSGGDFSGILSGNSSSGWSFTGSPTADILGRGHALGATTVTPPGGDAAIATFSCTNCHDPHGAYTSSTAIANKFRNLRISATGASLNAGITLNTSIKSWIGEAGGIFVNPSSNACPSNDKCVWPLYNDSSGALSGTALTDSNRSNAYPVTSEVSTDGISRWCAQCHDNWHEGIVPANGPDGNNDWRRHPVQTAIDVMTSGAGVSIINAINYNAAIATFQALPVANLVGTTNASVAYMKPTDLGGGFYGDANATVMCLSCHFAHGGPNYDNLRWNYTSAVSLGGQTGNSIASNVGCEG